VPYERPSGTPPQDPPRATDVRRLTVLMRITAVLVLVAILADMLSFPWFMAAGIVAIAAIVVGGRGLAVAAQTRQRSTPRLMIVLLLVVAVMTLGRPATTLLTWNAESAFARCQAGALTVQAQNACTAQYQQDITNRVNQLTGQTPTPTATP